MGQYCPKGEYGGKERWGKRNEKRNKKSILEEGVGGREWRRKRKTDK